MSVRPRAGRLAVVTGCRRGIGLAMAEALAARRRRHRRHQPRPGPRRAARRRARSRRRAELHRLPGRSRPSGRGRGARGHGRSRGRQRGRHPRQQRRARSGARPAVEHTDEQWRPRTPDQPDIAPFVLARELGTADGRAGDTARSSSPRPAQLPGRHQRRPGYTAAKSASPGSTARWRTSGPRTA